MSLSPPPPVIPAHPRSPTQSSTSIKLEEWNPEFKDVPNPLAKHFTALKRKSISYWNTVKTELAQPKRSFRRSLRSVAPLRFWVTILVLILLLICLLVWIIIKEDKTIASLANTLDTIQPEASIPWKKSTKSILLFVGFGAITSGLHMRNMAIIKNLQAAEAATAAEALIAEAPSFMEKRFPIINAILPGDPHEMILYALNFFMILQSVKVWQNWRHSPVAGAIRKWQSTRLNKMLRQRELRRIQRRAARELAKQSAPSGAAFATPSTARGLITRGGGFGSKVLSGMENVIFSILRVALSALGSIFMS